VIIFFFENSDHDHVGNERGFQIQFFNFAKKYCLMISHEEALKIILNINSFKESETIELVESLNRILKKDIVSDMNMPPFNKSAVDGYACRREDLPGPLHVIETIPAGILPKLEISPGNCSKIMTGAKVPEGADVIIMVEETEILPDQSILYKGSKTSSNICLLGEDMKSGDLVIPSGTLLKPWHLGIMASVGKVKVLVSEKVKIGIITTGDELTEPGAPLEEGKIRNSNAWQLVASCLAISAEPVYYGIVMDDLTTLTMIMKNAIADNDIVLVTGGVSMGDFDFVPQSIQDAGLQIMFDSVAMQPGRPLTYATDGQKHCFGLPGNPVSSFVQFELSVKPLIYKLMGHDFQPVFVHMKMNRPLTRKNAARKSFYPVEITDNGEVTPILYHGSAHINAFANAFGLISLEMGVYGIDSGEMVYVRQI
jgi:molybdopterin molybdotransferase